VIAGDHLDLDARLFTGGHRFNRLGTRRIDHALQPEKAHSADEVLVVDADGLCGHFHPGESQNAKPRLAHLLGRLVDGIFIDLRTAVEHLLDCALEIH